MSNQAHAAAAAGLDGESDEPSDPSYLPGRGGASARRIQRIPIEKVRAGDSPRLDGESSEHTRILADSGVALPPILVHRASMRVIDGMHRLHAAQLRGDQTIEVEFFDRPDDDAFIAAVQANIAHGLPLTLADRVAAAARIVVSHAQYSDRAIAAITGLSAGTVSEIRRRTVPDTDRGGAARIGRDGKVRPLNSAQARRLARDALADHPQASLREIARATGLSPTTVRDVRERMRRGEGPVPSPRPVSRRRATAATRFTPAVAAVENSNGSGPDHPWSNRARLLENLRKDPSLRFTEPGRGLLRELFARSAGPPVPHLLESLPPHCAYTVAALARACAQEWLDFANQLEHWFEAHAADAYP